MLVINGNTRIVKHGSVFQSKENINRFVADLKVKANVSFLAVDSDNRHLYELTYLNKRSIVAMPAVPLKDVRYMSLKNQKIYNFQRLYVDGLSWVWFYALRNCFR